MSLLLFDDGAVAKWVGERIGAEFFPPLTAIGILADDGEMCGGAVFHDFNGSNIEVTVVMDRPIRRSEVQGIVSYIFDQLQVRRVTFRTLAGNMSARRFLERHATFEAEIPAWFPGGDAVQYRLLADDPRWTRWRRAS